MRIVITHYDFRLYWIPRITALAKCLSERGDSLMVVEVAGMATPYDFAIRQTVENKENFKWIRLFDNENAVGLSPRKIATALWNCLEKLNPDVVIAGAIAFSVGAVSVRWCRARKRTVIIMDNARWNDVPRSPFVNYIKQRIYKNVDAMLIPAPSHSTSYIRWKVPSKRLFFGVNVVDNNWFAQQVESMQNNVDKFPKIRELPKKFFLGVGRQVEKKNWKTLIAAYNQYRKNCETSPWGLVLVGDGTQRSQLEKQTIDSLVEDVHFAPFADTEEICAYYGLASVLVLPSYYGETWGSVVNEAMACGLPVLVSTECGCVETLVQDGKNGWTFSPHSADELAKVLLKISGLSESELNSMGRKSREIVSEWPLDRFVDGVMTAVESCQGSRKGFASLVDRLILKFWKGRFRPT